MIINFYGDCPHYILNGANVEIVSLQKDLSLNMTHNINRSSHVWTRLQKANNTFLFVRRNVSGAIFVKSKLDLYKRSILSILCYASHCWLASRGDMRKIEQLQRRVTKWILPGKSDYRERLKLLNLLPFPMYIQVFDVLTLVKMCNGGYDIDPKITFKLEE